jgi:hypothetical protein
LMSLCPSVSFHKHAQKISLLSNNSKHVSINFHKKTKKTFDLHIYIYYPKTTLIDTTITGFAKEEANAPTETNLGLDDQIPRRGDPQGQKPPRLAPDSVPLGQVPAVSQH